MKSPAIGSRRADEFARLVDQPTAHRPGGRHSDLLEVVTALRGLEPVRPRPEFSASLRERLMADADAVLTPAPARTSPVRRPARTRRRLAAVVGAVALGGASTSVAMAAQSSLPGDPLHPVKGWVEDVRTAASGGDRGEVMLDRADERLSEAMALSVRGGDDGALVGPTLADFTAQAGSGADALLRENAESGDPAPITRLQEFSASSLATLESLDAIAPASARDELAEAVAAIEDASARAHEACADCGDAVRALPDPTRATGTSRPAQSQQPGDQAGPGPGAGDPGVTLPDVDPEDLPPGSVNQGEVSDEGTVTVTLDPVRDLTSGAASGTTGTVDEVVTSVTQPVEDLGGLLGQGTQVPDLTGDLVGDLVGEDLGDLTTP